MWAGGLATTGALIRQRVRGGGSCGPPAWYRVRPPLLVWLVWRISARVARACCALVIVARERYLIVTNAILIYKKGTERSKTAPKTLMTMHATWLFGRRALLQAVEGLTSLISTRAMATARACRPVRPLRVKTRRRDSFQLQFTMLHGRSTVPPVASPRTAE